MVHKALGCVCVCVSCGAAGVMLPSVPDLYESYKHSPVRKL